MLNADQERAWAATSLPDQTRALERARHLLGNLTHYPISRKTYYDEDLKTAAAELVLFRQSAFEFLRRILDVWTECWCNTRIGYICPATEERKSFVIAVALADYFQIEDQERYVDA